MGYILYLTFEAPFVNNIKIIFIRGRSDSNAKPVTQEEEMDSVSENNNIKEEKNNNLHKNKNVKILLNTFHTIS